MRGEPRMRAIAVVLSLLAVVAAGGSGSGAPPPTLLHWLLRVDDASTESATVVNWFERVARPSCASPHGWFGLAIRPHDHVHAQGCSECRFVLQHAREGGDVELLDDYDIYATDDDMPRADIERFTLPFEQEVVADVLARECRAMLDMPCCSSSGGSSSGNGGAPARLSSLLEVQQQERAQWLQSLAAKLHGKRQGRQLKELVEGKFPNQAKSDAFKPTKDSPNIGHNKCDPVSGKPDTMGEKAIRGLGDLHTHMFSHLGFGGVMIYGEPTGPQEEVLKPCDGSYEHGALTSQEFAHFERKDGYPTFNGWPRWDATAHQQVHRDWLHAAATRQDKFRFRVFTITPVHNEIFCLVARYLKLIKPEFVEAWTSDTGRPASEICDNVPNLERQIAAIKAFASAESSWAGVAFSPDECRTLVAENKLCIVISAGEAGDPCRINPADGYSSAETAEECVSRMYDSGARMLQLAHLRNNPWTGAGFHSTIVDKAHRAIRVLSRKGDSSVKSYLAKLGRVAKIVFGSVTDVAEEHMFNGGVKQEYQRNKVRLHEQGRELVRAAVAKNMIIDVAHISAGAFDDLTDLLAREHSWYPFLTSHTDIGNSGGKGKEGEDFRVEYHLTVERLPAFVRHGGVLGLRSTPWKRNYYSKAVVRDHCFGSATSYAQSYEFLVRELGLPIATASDLNGAATNSVPRLHGRDPHGLFRFEACGARAWPCWRLKDGDLRKILGMALDATLPKKLNAALEHASMRAREAWNDFRLVHCPWKLSETRQMQKYQLEQEAMRPRTNLGGYLEKGVGTIDAMTSWAEDVEVLGAEVDCPVCLTRSAENIVRMWERAHDEDRQQVPFMAKEEWDGIYSDVLEALWPEDQFDFSLPLPLVPDMRRAATASDALCRSDDEEGKNEKEGREQDDKEAEERPQRLPLQANSQAGYATSSSPAKARRQQQQQIKK